MTPQHRLNYQLIGVNQVLATILSYFVYYMIWREDLVSFNIPEDITPADAIWEVAKYFGIVICMLLYLLLHIEIEPQLFPLKNGNAIVQLLMRYLYLPIFSLFSDLSFADAIFVQFSLEIVAGTVAFAIRGAIRTKEKNRGVQGIIIVTAILACGVIAFIEPVIRSMEGYAGNERTIAIGGVAVVILSNVISLTKRFFMLKDKVDELHPWRKQWLDEFSEMKGKKLAIYIPMIMPIVLGFFVGFGLLFAYGKTFFAS